MNWMNGQMLPVVRAMDLASTNERIQWLIHELWAESAVGVLGGPPKSYKTWMALDMAVSLASQTPCIGTFQPGRQGRVLLYAAEDSQDILKQRLDAICGHRGLCLSTPCFWCIVCHSRCCTCEKRHKAQPDPGKSTWHFDQDLPAPLSTLDAARTPNGHEPESPFPQRKKPVAGVGDFGWPSGTQQGR